MFGTFCLNFSNVWKKETPFFQCLEKQGAQGFIASSRLA